MEDNQKSPGNGSLSVADPGEADIAGEIIADFCSWYSPEDIQKELLDLLLAALNSEEADNWNGAARGEFIFLYRQLAKLISALYTGRNPVPAEAATMA